jgi:hypothetical protein
VREQESTIDGWMVNSIENGGIDRFDDLHIDSVNEGWKPRDQWVEGAIAAYRMAVALRNRHAFPLVVSLGFSLLSSEKPLGFRAQTRQDFERQLDHTPPSLYLFRQGKEPWTEMKLESGSVQDFDCSALFKSAEPLGKCYYLEFKTPDTFEYHRSVFIAG